MKRLRILVVDDDRDFAEGLADALELEGHEVSLAYSGEEALETYTEFEFDLTFMDVKLPGRNGVESFLEIRRRFPGAKVVIMTGFSMDHLMDQARQKGVMGLFHKPLAFAEVLTLLQRAQQVTRVLVVDDDVDFARELRDLLEVAGYSVRSCHDGESAIRRCKEDNFDAMILDLRLPGASGIEVYRAAREAHPEIRVIPITAFAEEATAAAETADFTPFENVLRKPFSPGELLGMLERV